MLRHFPPDRFLRGWTRFFCNGAKLVIIGPDGIPLMELMQKELGTLNFGGNAVGSV